MGAPMTLFDVAQRGMSAQLVRMNAASSNLANSGAVASSEEGAYRPIRAVFAEQLDKSTGLSTVNVQSVMRDNARAIREQPRPSARRRERRRLGLSGRRELGDGRNARFRPPIPEPGRGALHRKATHARHDEAQMTVSSVYSNVGSTSSTTNTAAATKKSGLGSMDATDFLKLLTVQMQQQDPTNPMDQKDMLAQMAQFSTLSNNAEMNATLKAIAVKLGAIDAPATDTSSTGGITA